MTMKPAAIVHPGLSQVMVEHACTQAPTEGGLVYPCR